MGGAPLWMTLETGVATTWAMSGACFHKGCLSMPLFAGMFIPMVPPKMVVIDQFERGLMKDGVLQGILGHSIVILGGLPIVMCPIAMGIMDKGTVHGEMSFNHCACRGRVAKARRGLWVEAAARWVRMGGGRGRAGAARLTNALISLRVPVTGHLRR